MERILAKTDKNYNNSQAKKPLFSYTKNPVVNQKPQKVAFKYYLKKIQNIYQGMHLDKKINRDKFESSIILRTEKDGFIKSEKTLEQRELQKVANTVNKKNSFIKYAMETIPNPAPIFITHTVNGHLHPVTQQQLNPCLTGASVEGLGEEFDRMIYDGLQALTNFKDKQLKYNLYKKDKLNKKNRASIMAYEPMKTWVPHLHDLSIINSNFLLDHIKLTSKLVMMDNDLGRTEIKIFREHFEDIKSQLDYEEKHGKLWLNNKVYIEVLEVLNDDILKSITNYLTSYLETTLETNDKSKKNSIMYSAWAYYIGALREKYEPHIYGKKFYKFTRIRYTRLLISQNIYNRIMTKDFVAYLKNIGVYKQQNMMYEITKLIQEKKLSIFMYYEIFGRSSDYAAKYEKHNPNYINIVFEDYNEMIDCKSYYVYIYNDYLQKLEMKCEPRQVDLSGDTEIIHRQYCLETNGNKLEYEMF